jgi:hypothetical protein
MTQIWGKNVKKWKYEPLNAEVEKRQANRRIKVTYYCFGRRIEINKVETLRLRIGLGKSD